MNTALYSQTISRRCDLTVRKCFYLQCVMRTWKPRSVSAEGIEREISPHGATPDTENAAMTNEDQRLPCNQPQHFRFEVSRHHASPEHVSSHSIQLLPARMSATPVTDPQTAGRRPSLRGPIQLLVWIFCLMAGVNLYAITYTSNPSIGTFKNSGAGFKFRVSSISGSSVTFEVLPKTGTFGPSGTAV